MKITKTTSTLTTALALTISCALSAANAGTISITVENAVNNPDYDLTNDWGTEDWAYWAGTGNPESGTPSNDKSGSTLIGDMSAVGGGALRGSTINAKPLYDFVFTDGTSGGSPAENLIGLFNDQLDTIGAGVELNVTSPTADPFKIYVWATAFASEATLTATLGAESDSATYTAPNNNNRTPGALYTITVDPDSIGETVNLQLTLTDDNGATANVSLSGVAVGDITSGGNTSGGGGATINVTQEITAITSSGSALTSITYAGTTYSPLSSPTSMIDNKGSTDWLHIGGTAPANLVEACGSLDLSIGSLNHSFEAQFSGLTDSSLVFLLINGATPSQGDKATVYAVDAAGDRLGGGSSTITFDNTPFTDLTAPQTYNRTTNGAGNGTLDRLLVGMAFTLEDLGFDGLGATGLEIVTSTLDLQEIGLAEGATPPSSSLALDVAHNSTTDELTFTWDNQAGKVYDLLSSIDPGADGAPADWAVVAGQVGITAPPIIIATPVDTTRFYALQERDEP